MLRSKPATKSRGFAKMVEFGLIRFSEQGDDKKVLFIEPNYRILDTVVYRV
jgi:preprotein translocase subunit Sec61beta